MTLKTLSRLFSFIIFLLPFLGNVARAQQAWRSAGTLIDNRSLQILIDYQFPAGSCTDPARFRYRILRMNEKKPVFVYWRFDYLNCDNELVSRDVELALTPQTPAVLEDPSFSFSGVRVTRYAYAVLVSELRIVRQAAKASLPYSVEPKEISGESLLDKGSSTTLTLRGGYLAPGARWRWYQDGCGGLLIDTGRSVTVQPAQSTTYYVRAEGATVSGCVVFPVSVVIKNLPPARISGREIICTGEKDIALSVVGGRLGDGGRWIWYEMGEQGRKIGEGEQVLVSPAVTTTYLVRAEGPTNVTEYRKQVVTVATTPPLPLGINGPDAAERYAPLQLSVRGPALAADARWVWYTGTPADLKRVGSGVSVTVYPDQSVTYFVRAEGLCSNSDLTSLHVRVKGGRTAGGAAAVKAASAGNASRPYQTFINAGAVADDIKNIHTINNYAFTLGGGRRLGWYVRTKIPAKQINAGYQAGGDGYIADYNQSGYYRYNGQVLNKRKGYTGGLYWGGKVIAVYIGGGYGQRELLYGIDQYVYGSNYSSSTAWVKSSPGSLSGVEIEGGLLLRAGFINLMGGVSSIKGKYTDYQLGLGLNF